MDKLLSGQLVDLELSVWGAGVEVSEVLSACLDCLEYTGLEARMVVRFIYLFYLFFSLSTTCRCPDRNSTVSCFANYAGNALHVEIGF
jgi:hypothetical protein